MKPALFSMPFLPVLKRNREKSEAKGVEAFAYLDDISIGMIEVTSDTVEAAPFLQPKLASISMAIIPRKTAVIPTKGHISTLDDFIFLEGISVSIAERGGVEVVGVPIGTYAYAE